MALPLKIKFVVLEALKAYDHEDAPDAIRWIENGWPLTDAELRVLEKIASGLDTRDAANALSISERTLRTHLVNIYSKTYTSNRVQATLWAIKHGIVKIE